MATNYPTSLDTTTQLPNTRSDGTTSATNHAQDHNNLADAVLAIETELGADPSGTTYTNVAGAITNFKLGVHTKTRPFTSIMHPDFNVSASQTTTTGSITSGSPTLTVASASTFVANQGIYVVGAGAAGAVLETTILSVVGTTITLAVNASTTATTQVVGHSDTVGIQAAIDWVKSQSNGGTVFIPPGVYYISGVKVKPQVTLMGTGVTSQFFSIPGNTAVGMIQLSTTSDSYVQVFNMRLNGQKTSSPAPTNAGIYLDNTGASGDHVHRFESLQIQQCGGDGIALVGNCRANTFAQIYIIGCNGHGVSCASGSTDNSFTDLEIGNSGLNGVYDQAFGNRWIGTKCFLSGVVNSTTAGDGFRMGTGVAGMIEMHGCEAQSNRRHGFHFDGASAGSSTDGLLADSNAGRAYFLNSCTDLRVSGHAMYGNPDGVGPHSAIVELTSGVTRVKVDVTYTPGAIGAVAPVVNATTQPADIRVFKGGGFSSVAYSATWTPDPYAYDTALFNMAGDVVVANPTFKHKGQELRLLFAQDATANRKVTWGTDFKVNAWKPGSVASRVSETTFICDGTSWWPRDESPSIQPGTLTGWAPGAITTGTSATTTVTVTGAAVGDPAIVSFTTMPTGKWMLTAQVTAANTVTVELYNATGGSVTPSSGNLNALVFKQT